jgi:D-arabinose 5-phosphate isomerase GutQ
MPTASEKFTYLNTVFRSLLKEKRGQLKESYSILRDSDFWLYVSSGRSERSFEIPESEIAKNTGKEIRGYSDGGLKGDTLDIAAPKYENYHKSLLSIFITGSGKTPDTLGPLEQMASYLQESKSKKWKILLVTQSANSPAGKIVEENGGTVLELRVSENKNSRNYRSKAIMRDKFEIDNLCTFQYLGQAMVESKEYERFYEIVEQKLPLIGRKIDEWIESPMCNSLLDNLERHSDAFVGGRRGGRATSRFLLKRLAQEKQHNRDQAYLISGDNTPEPKIGDVVMLETKSAGMENFYSPALKEKESHVLTWARNAKDLRANVYSFVGAKNPKLEKISDHTVLIDSAGDDSLLPKGYTDTYTQMTILQNSISILLAERLKMTPEDFERSHGF